MRIFFDVAKKAFSNSLQGIQDFSNHQFKKKTSLQCQKKKKLEFRQIYEI